ncbi:VWA domain-containing protein [Desulfonema magnum]|nr:VWA domain-containing protein [Desulfonema magnum]
MKKYRCLKLIMIIGLSLLLISCSSSDDGSDGCDCKGDPISDKEGGLVLSFEDQDEKAPANVSLLFKVETKDGIPITDLRSDHFKIYEDDDEKPISDAESKQAILPKPGKFKFHTLLLLDLSASVLESDSLKTLKEAAKKFADEIMPAPNSENFGEIDMGIWYFDGADGIHRLAEFDEESDELISKIYSIDTKISNDPSTNLYGAIIKGIEKVEGMVGKRGNTITVGSVVVFTDGRDEADRKTREEALQTLYDTGKNVSVYTIGLGGDIDDETLAEFGRDGFVLADDISELVEKFEDIAERILKDVNSYYLLEYCSPKRKGSHDLTISAEYYYDSEDKYLSGSLTTCFCASGFRGGCEIPADD